jgi:hypothetical protein
MKSEKRREQTEHYALTIALQSAVYLAPDTTRRWGDE